MKLLEIGQLKGLQEGYTKVQAHLADASSDPPNLPYRSKYMALEELARMRDLVTELGEGEHQSAISSFLLTKVEISVCVLLLVLLLQVTLFATSNHEVCKLAPSGALYTTSLARTCRKALVSQNVFVMICSMLSYL